MDVREQRVSFVVTASRGEKSFSALCQEYGITRPTGYLWLGRYRQEGLAGIAERSRRPWLSPGQTPPEMEARVVAWRECYPDWGARKLQVMLAREGLRLTRSTVHRILLRHGLVPQAEVACHAPQRFERSAPNELWQMDFKGPMGRGDKLGPLSILDDHSRYLLALRQVSGTGGAEVREHLEHRDPLLELLVFRGQPRVVTPRELVEQLGALLGQLLDLGSDVVESSHRCLKTSCPVELFLNVPTAR